MKPGDIEYDENKDIQWIVTIGETPRDAVLRAEEFIRGFFGDDSLFVGNVADTVEVGQTMKGNLYKVLGF